MFLSLIYIKGQFVEAFVGQVGLLYKKTNGFRYLETGSAEGLSAVIFSGSPTCHLKLAALGEGRLRL